MALGNGNGENMTVEMDLQALVMGSESLLSHIARPDGIPRLTKSLAEIVSGILGIAWLCGLTAVYLGRHCWVSCGFRGRVLLPAVRYGSRVCTCPRGNTFAGPLVLCKRPLRWLIMSGFKILQYWYWLWCAICCCSRCCLCCCCCCAAAVLRYNRAHSSIRGSQHARPKYQAA